MGNESVRKIVLVVRATRLDELVARYNTIAQARFYVEHLGADFSDYLVEHQRYQDAVTATEATLGDFGLVQRLDRRFLPNFIFGSRDGVVVLGQDGLVANTLKYLDGHRVVAVNPDPGRWEGVLLPFTVREVRRVMEEERANQRPVKYVRMAQVALTTGEHLLAVNDIFIGRRTHASARYALVVGNQMEAQSSSGVIVSTGLGSTGWLKSIRAGWRATSQVLLGSEMTKTATDDGAFPWDAECLHWYVREPFQGRSTGADLVLGWLNSGDKLRLLSQMPEEGVIFSDGIEEDFLAFNSGAEATVSIAKRCGVLVV